MTANWLLHRLEVDQHNEIEVNCLYNIFKLELIECNSESTLEIPPLRVFVDILNAVFPTIRRVRKKRDSKWLTLYRGVSIRPLQPLLIQSADLKELAKCIPQTYSVIKIAEKAIVCTTESGHKSNGNSVMKTLTFYENGTWELSVSGKIVNLKDMDIVTTYTLDEISVVSTCSLVQKLNVCVGIAYNKNVIVSRYHIIEQFQTDVTAAPVRTLRSLSCMAVLPFSAQSSTCATCRKMTFTCQDKENTKTTAPGPDKNDEQNAERIKHLLKHANPELVDLLLEQSKNIARDPRGRRWSKSFIGTCLQLYNRSPHSYDLLLSSKMLILPSASVLIMYKNKLKQEPGFDHSMFQWMLKEAKRRDIPEDGMSGGLIFDEMSIQSDIQINKNGDVVELVGFTELGKEGDLCHTIRKGTMDRKMGTHVLQLLYLGITGFRFPFAHFISDSVQASELYGIFWKAVQHLKSYGFSVVYTCMDGAVCNRSLMHACVGEDNSYLHYNFLATSPSSSQTVIFIMDVSHVLKKIRNNIMKSGIHEKSTRNLTLQSGHEVQWQMFIDCYQWDTHNSLQLHRKLTNEHIFPDNQQKMRNHLAEEVLNSEMLHLMKQYRNSLGEKGQVLDGVVDILHQTSQVVAIFRDMRAITDSNDPRLSALQQVSDWFLSWECFVHEDSSKSPKEKQKMLMSKECHEDIQACLQGFILLCNTALKRSNKIHIIPGLVNSDVIENIFNQQRSTYNGANSNPNALQYRKTINSILVGQNVVSRKSNAGKSMTNIPFSVEMKKAVRKDKPRTEACSSSNIKVIRV